jgi:hypothetical protein
MDKPEELEEQVAELKRVVGDLRARLLSLEGGAARPALDAPRSRRDLLRLGGVAALGAVGAVALAATPASAATSGNFILGQSNNAENVTTLNADSGAPVPVLAVQAQGFSSSTLNTANGGSTPFAGTVQGLGASGAVEGVDGWASGSTAFAVYGFTDAGTGVVGESGTGIGLYARRSGRIRQDPRAAGVPNYTPNAPEQVRDANHALWISTATGGWKQIVSQTLFPTPRRVYDGYFQPTGPGTYGPIDATAQVNTSNWPGGVSGVPAGATHAFCAVQSYAGPGVMTLFPDLTADTHVANWGGAAPAGQLSLLYVFVPLSAAGKFKIHTYYTGQTFIDAWGFVM